MDGPKQRHAVDAAHLHVGQHRIGPRQRQLGQGGFPTVGCFDLEPVGF